MSRQDHSEAGTWDVVPTPVSLRRMAEERRTLQERKRVPAAGATPGPAAEASPPSPPRSAQELTEDEMDAVETRSLAGLVRSVEAQQLHVTGAYRRALQGKPWLPPDEAA